MSLQLSNKRIGNIGGYAAKVFNDKYSLGFFANNELGSPHNTSHQKANDSHIYSAPESIRKQLQARSYERDSVENRTERTDEVSIGELIKQATKMG